MTVRIPASWGLLVGAFYEEITAPGNVAFAWPALPSGAKATYELTQTPAGSTSTASLSGSIVGADLPGCYVLVRSVRLQGQADDIARDVGVLYWPPVGEDVTAPVPPARVEHPAGTTASGTITWTHADPPDSPVYTLAVYNVTDGTTVTPSGSGLSWSWTVATGKSYVAVLTCTSGAFSADAAPLAVVVEGEVLTAPTPPAQGPPSPAGTTSVSLTWTHAGAPGGVTYALTANDTATGDPVVPASGSGLGPYVLPTTDGQEIVVTLLCTRTSDGQTARSLPYYVAVSQDVADTYPVEGAAGWRTVRDYDCKAQGTQGPIPNGAGTITLGADTITTRGATAGAGTFGTNNVSGVSPTDGIYLECTTTASMLPELTLTLPLGETLGAEHALRVSMKVRIYNEDSNDSVAIYVADPAVTPSLDVSSSSDVGGCRVLGQTASLTYRRGAAASSGVTVPAGWASGTLLYVECIVPGYGNDMIVRLDDAGFLAVTPDQRGRTQSGPASPTTTATAWADGLSTIKLMLGVYNGGTGAGTPKATIESIKIEVR